MLGEATASDFEQAPLEAEKFNERHGQGFAAEDDRQIDAVQGVLGVADDRRDDDAVNALKQV